MLNRLEFLVHGSADVPYRVTFVRRSETSLSAYCTCPAGDNGQYCKHRFAIMDGDARHVVSDNIADVAVVCGWLPGTEVASVLAELRRLELVAAKVKKDVSVLKKRLALVMRG